MPPWQPPASAVRGLETLKPADEHRRLPIGWIPTVSRFELVDRPDSLPDGAIRAWKSAEATLARSRTFVHDPAPHHRHDRPDVPDLVGGNREVVAVEDHQIG